jgi:hypothetical protein
MMVFGIGAMDAFYANRKQAIFQSSVSTFFFQIPEMKVEMLPRTA